MSAVPFDTLKYAEALKTAGVPEAQAKAQAEALADVLRQGGQNLVTKADLKAELAELKAELKADIAKLQTDIGWVKWIITGGVGLYVLRSIMDWIR